MSHTVYLNSVLELGIHEHPKEIHLLCLTLSKSFKEAFSFSFLQTSWIHSFHNAYGSQIQGYLVCPSVFFLCYDNRDVRIDKQ